MSKTVNKAEIFTVQGKEKIIKKICGNYMEIKLCNCIFNRVATFQSLTNQYFALRIYCKKQMYV